jgi:hypothetical protein
MVVSALKTLFPAGSSDARQFFMRTNLISLKPERRKLR